MSKEEDVILLGKPLSEYPKTYGWLMDKIRKNSLGHNRIVFRNWYKNKRYHDLGMDILMHGSNYFDPAYYTIGYARVYTNEVLDGLDMTPLIPYLELGLQFNQDYDELVRQLVPVFAKFREKYGSCAGRTIAHRFDMEVWQGYFAPLSHSLNAKEVKEILNENEEVQSKN